MIGPLLLLLLLSLPPIPNPIPLVPEPPVEDFSKLLSLLELGFKGAAALSLLLGLEDSSIDVDPDFFKFGLTVTVGLVGALEAEACA